MKMVPVVFTAQETRLPDGELVHVMVPLARYAKVARRQFVLGEEYPLVVLETRSRASHSQYFAALADAFDNLPETIAARWPTAEHLRKWALIETGWCDEREVEFGSPLYAKRAALLLHQEFDEHARIYQPNNGTKLIIRRAKSQSAAAMAKAEFEASKRAVLELVEDMIGLERGKLKKNARRSA